MTHIATTNLGSRMPAEDQVLQVTVVFAPFDRVLPVVAGLFRAQYGFSRAVEPATERQWTRLNRLEKARKAPTMAGDPLSSVQSVRIVEPEQTPGVTILEDFFGPDPDALAKMLPGVDVLHLFSEYCRKDAERHSYQWRSGGKVTRQAYIHHNYQEPGWHWKEAGPRLTWENQDRITSKRISHRCDRALILDYAARLGCDLDGALGDGRWTRAILLYNIDPTDCDDRPPTDLGGAERKEAVKRGFGQGEEGLSFEGYIADNRMDMCALAYTREMLEQITKTRSAKRLLEIMVARDPSPDGQDELPSDHFLWDTALARARDRFPDAPETAELKRRAKSETGRDQSRFRP